jgi:branched-chain amino acid transport system ATP-binding protein
LAAESLLQMQDVYSGYGPFDVLRGVSLEVFPREIVSVVGPNGAGKSTIFRTICGFLRPRSGQIRFKAEQIAGFAPDRMAERGLAYIPQGRSVFPHMTVWENLELAGYIRQDRAEFKKDLESVASRFPILQEKSAARAGSLSGGQQQLVEIARCLLLRPSLILADEPSLGLSPKFASMIFDVIRQLREGGTTVLLVEQNALRALEISDRGYVLDLGRIRFQGTGAELLSNEEVKQTYLGG